VPVLVLVLVLVLDRSTHNIGEGAGKTSVAERAHCYAIARGEAMECGAMLDVARLLSAAPDVELVRGKHLVVRMVEMLCATRNIGDVLARVHGWRFGPVTWVTVMPPPEGVRRLSDGTFSCLDRRGRG